MPYILPFLLGKNSKKSGYNLSSPVYFGAVYPFIDVMKNSPDWNNTGGPKNQDDWLTALPAGSTGQCGIAFGMDANWGYFPPGNYIFKSTSAATLNVPASAGVSAVVSGVGVCTFTVSTLPGAWDTLNLYLQFTNNTASPIAVLDGTCMLVSEVSIYTAGEIFKPQYISDFGPNPQCIRAMDWMVTNNNRFRKLADYEGGLNESCRQWCGRNTSKGFYTPVPPSITAKLAKKLNCPAWVPMPHGGGEMYFATVKATSRITNYADAAGTIIMPHGYAANERLVFQNSPIGIAPATGGTQICYVVNPTTNDYQIALTPSGTPIAFTHADTVPSDNGLSVGSIDITPLSDLWTPIISLMYAAFPGMQPVAEVSNEIWNFGFSQAGWLIWQGAMQYNNSTGTAGSYVAWANHMMLVFKAWESIYPPAQVTWVFADQVAVPHMSVFDSVDVNHVLSSGSTLKALFSARLSRCLYAGAPYINADDGAGHVGPGGFTPTTAYVANGNSAAIPDSYWATVFGRGLTTAVGWISAARIAAQGRVPGIRIAGYEYGHQFFAQGDVNSLAVGNNLAAYLEGTGGGALYALAKAQIIDPYMDGPVNHFNGPDGGYGTRGNAVSLWPIKGTTTDTPRSIAWKNF